MRLTDPDFQNYLKTLDMRLTENLGIPKVKGIKFKNLSEVDFLGFNYSTSDENVRKGGKYVHFFLPDHYIERVWNNLDHYEGVFNAYRGIVQPDFSLYTDSPLDTMIRLSKLRIRLLLKSRQETRSVLRKR